MWITSSNTTRDFRQDSSYPEHGRARVCVSSKLVWSSYFMTLKQAFDISFYAYILALMFLIILR